MSLQSLDRTQWSYAEALAHVQTVTVARRAVEAAKLPPKPAPAYQTWNPPQDPTVAWKAEAETELLVALRDGDNEPDFKLPEDVPDLAEKKGITSLTTIVDQQLDNTRSQEFHRQPDELCRSIWAYAPDIWKTIEGVMGMIPTKNDAEILEIVRSVVGVDDPALTPAARKKFEAAAKALK